MDLNKFTSRDFNRPKLFQPVKIGDFVYATNGHIAVKVKADGLDYKGVDGFPDIVSLYETDLPILKVMDIDFSKIKLPTEPMYEKIGDEVKCSQCEGEGFIECDLGYEHDCPKCNGEGIISTIRFNTDKIIGEQTKKEMTVKIHDSYFNPVYIELICEESPFVGEVQLFGTTKAAKIIFPNSEMLLMPVNPYNIKGEVYELKSESELQMQN